MQALDLMNQLRLLVQIAARPSNYYSDHIISDTNIIF
eukprot:COSAG02_NODE_40531_length_404_cov_1.009836_1_plen_36_part_01